MSDAPDRPTRRLDAEEGLEMVRSETGYAHDGHWPTDVVGWRCPHCDAEDAHHARIEHEPGCPRAAAAREWRQRWGVAE